MNKSELHRQIGKLIILTKNSDIQIWDIVGVLEYHKIAILHSHFQAIIETDEHKFSEIDIDKKIKEFLDK